MNDQRPDDEKGNCEFRRDLRTKQRKTLLGIKGDCDAFDAARDTNNRLFKRVRYARELKLDAEIMEARTEACVQHFQNLHKPLRFDPLLVVKRLKGAYLSMNAQGNKTFDWKSLGIDGSVCVNALPRKITFLSGPLMNDEERLKLRKKKRVIFPRSLAVESAVELIAEEMETTSRTGDGNDNKLTDTELHMKTLKRLLRIKCAEAAQSRQGGAASQDPEALGNEIDLVPFLFNPKSFTQTIENVLDFSHLIKKGLAGIRRSNSGAVYIRCIAAEEERETPDATSTGRSACQAVLSMSLKAWRRLIEAYDLEEGALPDRNYKQVATFSTKATQKDADGTEAPRKTNNSGEVEQGAQSTELSLKTRAGTVPS